VHQVDDLFQSFDPAPMESRRVATEADTFITERAAEVPESHSLRLTIRLPAGESRCCEAVQQAFRKLRVRGRQTEGHAAPTLLDRLAHLFVGVLVAIVLVYLSQYIVGVSRRP
jgi:hypothetical protein